jgi:hypothetical protein
LSPSVLELEEKGGEEPSVLREALQLAGIISKAPEFGASCPKRPVKQLSTEDS